MAMSRKDFVAIADALKASKPGYPIVSESIRKTRLEQWTADVNMIADRLRCTNANFDRARFLSYVGVEG